MIWLFHKTILAEVKRNNDQRGHWTKARFPWSTETLGPHNPFRREGIITLKDPITRNGPFNDFSSFVISKPNIYCLIQLPFLFGTSGKFKSLFEHLKAEKTQSMLPDFSLSRPTRISEKKNNLNTNTIGIFLQRNYFTYMYFNFSMYIIFFSV